MKMFYLIPLVFLSACSTTPKLVLQPKEPSGVDAAAVRYPEVVRAYHFGRYADPSDDLVMHEQHVAYRVEENTRWDLHPAIPASSGIFSVEPVSRDPAFSPAPVNDAVLVEVNSQRLATSQIMTQAQTLCVALAQFQTALQQTKTNLQETAILRATVNEMKQRLAVLEMVRVQLPAPSLPTTNEPLDSLSQ
jgi:hypothetical protein